MDMRQITMSTTPIAVPPEHVLNVMDKPKTAGDNDGICRAQCACQRGCDAEASDGERLGQPFT
jgi:hypothetical protein